MSGNTIIGASGTAAIELGESVGAFHVRVLNNAIVQANGSGIVVGGGGSTDLDVENNVVDRIAISGTPSYGIAIYNVAGSSRVVGNFVRCTTSGTPVPCANGLVTGGGNGQNAWSDGNVVTGVTNNGGLAIQANSSAGLSGAGQCCGQTGSNIWIGRNVDLDTGAEAPPYNDTNAAQIPVLWGSGGSFSASVAGSKVWQISQGGSNGTITGLTDGTVGQTVTLTFIPGGSGYTSFIANNGWTGVFDLSAAFTSTGTSNSIIVLLCTSTSPQRWVEVSRSID